MSVSKHPRTNEVRESQFMRTTINLFRHIFIILKQYHKNPNKYLNNSRFADDILFIDTNERWRILYDLERIIYKISLLMNA